MTGEMIDHKDRLFVTYPTWCRTVYLAMFLKLSHLFLSIIFANLMMMTVLMFKLI